MLALAQRAGDFRYTKGWGPDELASRAAISRTALYQIESGKTELPRAGTLRRIALALEVSMDCLLGHDGVQPTPVGPSTRTRPAGRGHRGETVWIPAEGGPFATPTLRSGAPARVDGAIAFEAEPNG